MFYKQEIEMSNVISSLPTLLLIAFLFWSFRRASGAMGGMGGGKIQFTHCVKSQIFVQKLNFDEIWQII